MGSEIERRFLLEGPPPVNLATLRRLDIEQRYLPRDDEWTMRVRRIREGGGVTHAMALKRLVRGFTRDEVDVEIPEALHASMAAHAGPALRKTRWKLPHGDLEIEIDAFRNPEFGGLWIAEVELPSEDHPFDAPTWFGREISTEPEWTNAALGARLETGR